jgi:anti-sigma factor RsiW
MKMHEHDHDIITALAEGFLDPEAAARAEAAISTCDECNAELELQRLALTALRNAPAVYLSASESALLHDRLRRELRIAPSRVARTQLRPAWSRWAALAAGTAAVFLAAFLVLPNLLGGSDDSAESVAFEQMADEASGGADGGRTATTAAASEAPRAAVPSEDAADMGMAVEESAPTTTVATPETTAAPNAVGDGAVPGFLFEGDLTEQLRLEIADQLQTDADYFEVNAEEIAQASPEWLLCRPQIYGFDQSGSTPLLVGRIVDDLGEERLLVALLDDEDPAALALQSITIPECEIYETALP